MKSQKGVSLISLTIYVIVMTIVIGIVAIVSTYFYSNIGSNKDTISSLAQYTSFNAFFVDEVNHNNIRVLDCQPNYVAFDNGVQYTFVPENKGVYRNKIKISNQIEKCNFNYNIKNGKETITVQFKAMGDTQKEQIYTLKN